MCHEIHVHSKKPNDMCYIVVSYVSSGFYMLRGVEFTTSINTCTRYFVSMGLLLPLIHLRNSKIFHFSIDMKVIPVDSDDLQLQYSTDLFLRNFRNFNNYSKSFHVFSLHTLFTVPSPCAETRNAAMSISNHSEFPAIHPSKPSEIISDKNIYYRG